MGAKTNEIPLTTLLDRPGIQDAVITADALHAQREHATYLYRRGADYLLIVKRNQSGLHAHLTALPWRDVPKAYDKRAYGRGRAKAAHPEGHRRRRGPGFPARSPAGHSKQS